MKTLTILALLYMPFGVSCDEPLNKNEQEAKDNRTRYENLKNNTYVVRFDEVDCYYFGTSMSCVKKGK